MEYGEKRQTHKILVRIKIPLAVGLEVMCVTLWLKMCLSFAHALRLWGKLRLQLDQLI